MTAATRRLDWDWYRGGTPRERVTRDRIHDAVSKNEGSVTSGRSRPRSGIPTACLQRRGPTHLTGLCCGQGDTLQRQVRLTRSCNSTHARPFSRRGTAANVADRVLVSGGDPRGQSQRMYWATSETVRGEDEREAAEDRSGPAGWSPGDRKTRVVAGQRPGCFRCKGARETQPAGGSPCSTEGPYVSI